MANLKEWEVYVDLHTGEDYVYDTYKTYEDAVAATVKLAASASVIRKISNVTVIYPLASIERFLVRHVSSYKS